MNGKLKSNQEKNYLLKMVSETKQII